MSNLEKSNLRNSIIVWSDMVCSKNFTLHNTLCMSTVLNNVSNHARRNCPRSSYWLRSQSLLGPGPLAGPKCPVEIYSILLFQEKILWQTDKSILAVGWSEEPHICSNLWVTYNFFGDDAIGSCISVNLKYFTSYSNDEIWEWVDRSASLCLCRKYAKMDILNGQPEYCQLIPKIWG